jgi:hypothetical protein
MPRSEIEEAFDAALAEIQERERAGERFAPREPMPPAVADAVAALKAIFEDDHRLTADLSFDQLYAKVLPHLITVMKHVLASQQTEGHR